MKRISLPQAAHNYFSNHLQQGALAIDATIGNGHDTLFLSKTVGPNGHVYGFDIQSAAMESTQNLLLTERAINNVTLFHISHADMTSCIPDKQQGRIQAIMFNLGYLPGSDKSLITITSSTLQALTMAIELLAVGGSISILAYPGHPGGAEETVAVEQWFDTLKPEKFRKQIFLSQTVKPDTPRLLLLKKKHNRKPLPMMDESEQTSYF